MYPHRRQIRDCGLFSRAGKRLHQPEYRIQYRLVSSSSGLLPLQRQTEALSQDRVCLAAGSKTKEGKTLHRSQRLLAEWRMGISSCPMKMKDAARSILHRGLSLTAPLPPLFIYTASICFSFSFHCLHAATVGLGSPSAWAFKSCDQAATDWSRPPHLTCVSKRAPKLFSFCVTDSNSTRCYLPMTIRNLLPSPYRTQTAGLVTSTVHNLVKVSSEGEYLGGRPSRALLRHSGVLSVSAVERGTSGVSPFASPSHSPSKSPCRPSLSSPSASCHHTHTHTQTNTSFKNIYTSSMYQLV